jgi:16S rRNA (uracil1498-N3)-methyltransferase
MVEPPYFYFPSLARASGSATLDDITRHHVVTVLRMQPNQKIMLMDGVGNIAEGIIQEVSKKTLSVLLGDKIAHTNSFPKITLGISVLKNANRFEWMLEKVTEIGVSEIIPLISDRTERTHFREDRLRQIIVSASIQSKQSWMPILHPPQKVHDVIEEAKSVNKFIAHCIDTQKNMLKKQDQDAIILIGPEGDFTIPEIDFALAKGFTPVSLGESRLRTETAGVAAAVLMKL